MTHQKLGNILQIIKMKITTKDVIKKQIETAIFLYFQEKDSIPIHTLACAAHEILHQLCNKNDIEPFMSKKLIDSVKIEKQKEFRKIINVPKIFFKHLQGINNKIEFNPAITDFWIWDGCLMYKEIFKEQTKEMEMFITWFNFNNHDLLKDEKIIMTALKWQNLFPTKAEFYNYYINRSTNSTTPKIN